MINLLSAAVAALFATSAAQASPEPVYLTCTLNDDPDWIMDVQLNEQVGIAHFQYRHSEGGRLVTRPAAFTASTIQFETYKIDRTDLSFTKQNGRNWWDRDLPAIQRGLCKLDERDRAI